MYKKYEGWEALKERKKARGEYRHRQIVNEFVSETTQRQMEDATRRLARLEGTRSPWFLRKVD